MATVPVPDRDLRGVGGLSRRGGRAAGCESADLSGGGSLSPRQPINSRNMTAFD